MQAEQVNKEHYEFEKYMSPARWASVWHQLREVRKFKPEKTLEIGPGPGTFKTLAQTFGMKIETVDLDKALNPDHVASATDLPFPQNSFDVTCAFQVLEHLPYDSAITALKELLRVSKKGVVISLPNAQPVWKIYLNVPLLPRIAKIINQPHHIPATHEFDGEHYWEIGKKEYELKRILRDIEQHALIISQSRIFDNPHHHFFIMQKR